MAPLFDNPVLQVIHSRRSVRRFQSSQLMDSQLEAILEAGRCAPSGGNSRTSHFLVLQRPAVLADLRELVQDEFSKMEAGPDTYKSIVYSINASKGGNYRFFFDAPTLVVAANRRGYGNAMADCAVALENMMLAAAALGVGSCWINQLRWLDGNSHVRGFLERLGLSAEETVCGGLALGYPDQTVAALPERTGNPVTWVR